MDLVDIIAEKRFLGQEFLTWLWFKSEQRGGSIQMGDAGDITIVFEKHMLLEYGEGDSHEKLVCQGLQAEMNEARTGLKMGKKIEQARILMGIGEYEWNFTLKASLFDYKSVKPPKTMASTEESDDPDAIEGRILEKISLHEQAVKTIDELFRMFLTVRVSAEWETELVQMRNWIHKEMPQHQGT